MNVGTDKISVIQATVKTAQELQQRDNALIQQHQDQFFVSQAPTMMLLQFSRISQKSTTSISESLD